MEEFPGGGAPGVVVVLGVESCFSVDKLITAEGRCGGFFLLRA